MITTDPGHGILTALDTLCPMHCIISRSGHITHAGATLQKLRPDTPLIGQRFLNLFQPVQPRNITSIPDLHAAAARHARLRLRFRNSPRTDLQGLMVPHGSGGAIVNLSFGISIIDAVQDYALSNADFAATDPTVEMLFLVEAKSAAMEASRKLTRQLHVAKLAAEEQALTDPLTGLKNRRAVNHILHRMIDSAQEFALMHLDLDYFKRVNDDFGHAAGDHVLKSVATIMVDETRSEDVVARTGGDEFVLLFHSLCDRNKIEGIATRLLARLERPIPWQGDNCRISASMGTALSVDYNAPSAERMLADSDAALYRAKRNGRAQHLFHDQRPPLSADGANPINLFTIQQKGDPI